MAPPRRLPSFAHSTPKNRPTIENPNEKLHFVLLKKDDCCSEVFFLFLREAGRRDQNIDMLKSFKFEIKITAGGGGGCESIQ